MPLEFAPGTAAERAADLNTRLGDRPAPEILGRALADPMLGPVALVSSFGAEAVALLHMVAQVDRTTPVLFIETGMLFPETLAYQVEVSERLGLEDLRILGPDPSELLEEDRDGQLYRVDTDACCALRKVRPLERALGGFETWITGRKRFHGGPRGGLDVFEAEGTRIKINPLAHWTRQDVAAYISDHALPRHPLVAHGYPSIGCAPCTGRARPDEDPRAGRWRSSSKTECGIHFSNGRARPGAVPQEDRP